MQVELATRRSAVHVTDPGTAAREITPPPAISETRTAAKLLTEDIGFDRGKVRVLTEQFEDLHHRSHSVEWRTRTVDRGRASAAEMLTELGDLGFAWRDVARLVGVSVPAIQKWRRGDRATGENRRKVASILAACDLIVDHYEVQEIASWFEMPMVAGVPIAPIDIYVAERADLVFEYAGGGADPEQIMSSFDSEWRDRYRSDFEVFRSGDGSLSVRSKSS